jgi:hypothetical protein
MFFFTKHVRVLRNLAVFLKILKSVRITNTLQVCYFSRFMRKGYVLHKYVFFEDGVGVLGQRNV